MRDGHIITLKLIMNNGFELYKENDDKQEINFVWNCVCLSQMTE